MLASLLLISAALGATTPAGDTVDPALAVQVTPEGLQQVGGLVPAFAPDRVDLEPMGDSGGTSGFCLTYYEFHLQDAWVGTEVTGVELVPVTDLLLVQVHLDVWLNEPTDRFQLDYEAACLGETCPGYVEPFPVTATVPFTLAVVDGPEGEPIFDATMGEIELDHGLTSAHIKLDCNVDALETALNFFGLSLYELIISMAESELTDALEDQRDALEAAIEELLQAARLDTELEVAGVPLQVTVLPSDVQIRPEGLAIVASGRVDAEPDPCMDALDPGGSEGSGDPLPALGVAPAGAHLGILLADDFGNQALYALWRGGLFCWDSREQDDLPLPMNTTLLGVIGGEPFQELFPESRPMVVRTDPLRAPTVDFEGEQDVEVRVRDLGIDFHAELDYRMAHALGVAVDVDAGLGLHLADGELQVQVALEGDRLRPRVAHNELAPGHDEAIVAGLDGLVGTLLDGLLGDALGDLAFGVPGFEGIGLVSLAAEAVPGAEGWLGLWAELGEVEGTEDDTGCDGGCATAPLGPWLPVLALLLLRRRRAT